MAEKVERVARDHYFIFILQCRSVHLSRRSQLWSLSYTQVAASFLQIQFGAKQVNRSYS